MRLRAHSNGKHIIVVALLYLFTSGTVVYWAVAKYDLSDMEDAAADTKSYIRIYRGEPAQNVSSPMRLRVLTPYLARLVPELPESVSRHYKIGERAVNMKFGVVNTLFLWLTGCVLYLYLLRLGFSRLESLLGGYLFYASFFVVTYGGLPCVDPGAYFFIISGLYALMVRNWWLFGLSFAVGMTAKETTVLLLPMAAALDWRNWRNWVIAIPVIVVYGYFRISLSFPTDQSILSRSITSRFTLYGLIELCQAFLFLWFLGLYGLLKCEKPEFLRKTMWVAILPFFAVLLLGTDVGRILFLNFWIVIPLSLLALRKLVVKKVFEPPSVVKTYNQQE
jgi:hypothetical protein